MILQCLGSLLWTLLFLPLFIVCSVLLVPGFLHLFRKSGRRLTEYPAHGALSGLQAAATSLAATVGTGNIIGTAQAIAMGGPGAVFWMWVAGILGFFVKCAEIWFGQKNARGAAGTIKVALGKRWADFYAFLAVLSTLFVGNMAQMNTVIVSAQGTVRSWTTGRLFMSLILLALLCLALYSGISSLGKIFTYLVPLMTLLFLFSAFDLLWHSPKTVAPVLREIIREAIHPQAAYGACGALVSKKAILWGLRRGVFSNEAGLGTAGTVHSLVCAEDPDRHALWGLAEVGADTLVLSTVSAVTLLCSGVSVPLGSLPGAELWFRVYACPGSIWCGRLVLQLCLCSFGISTVLGCYVPGSLCASSVGIGEGRYRGLYLFCAALGCLLPTDFIWLSADLINVLMAAPNLLSLLLLAQSFGKGCEQSKNNQEKRDSSLARRERKV